MPAAPAQVKGIPTGGRSSPSVVLSVLWSCQPSGTRSVPLPSGAQGEYRSRLRMLAYNLPGAGSGQKGQGGVQWVGWVEFGAWGA